MSGSWRAAAAGSFLLLLYLWVWSWTGQQSDDHLPFWLVAAILSVPMLPPAVAFLLRRPRAPLWAGIAALFYFCHGITELRVWNAYWPALEVMLAVAVVVAAGWPGIAAKLAKRRTAPPPPNV